MSSGFGKYIIAVVHRITGEDTNHVNKGGKQKTMRGIELSEKYYHEYGERMIAAKFSQYQDCIAVGLVGDGSECYGFDDLISRDHDWGPGFCLWLKKDDYGKIRKALQQEYEKLPQSFEGFKRLTSQFGVGRVGVFEIGEFYEKFIGLPRAPETLDQWLYLPENYLAACTNGKVFFDPLGEFSRIRTEILNFYPADVRLAKIAARCMSSAQSGQYNYQRSIKRNEYYVAQYAETKFLSDILSLVFLLNRQYTPFYKWAHRAVRKLPLLGNFIYQKVDDLITTLQSDKKAAIIEEISVEVINSLRQEGLTDSESNFLLDHGPIIHSKIKDKNLIKRDIWAN